MSAISSRQVNKFVVLVVAQLFNGIHFEVWFQIYYWRFEKWLWLPESTTFLDYIDMDIRRSQEDL